MSKVQRGIKLRRSAGNNQESTAELSLRVWLQVVNVRQRGILDSNHQV
jgi:hypothetical protein